MNHYLLTYTLTPDYLERRPAFRDQHLKLARAAAARGDLLLAGALDPPIQAHLLFAAETPDPAKTFAHADPYVTNGLVTEWRVQEWLTVIGKHAAKPL